jgi:hypothetical protein
MNVLPKVKRGLSSALSNVERIKKGVLGIAVAAVVASAGLAAPEAQAAPPQVLASGPVVLLATFADDAPSYHYSHSSHYSHQSHQSHFSSRF